MKYAGIVKQSLVDYPGEIAAVLFTRGCNMRCPFCHNGELLIRSRDHKEQDLEEETIMEFLRKHHGFLDAVVFSGGEPSLYAQEGLIDNMRRVKEMGFKVKLDTNGTDSMWLEHLIEKNLIDYVAMDIKHILDYRKYLQAVGSLSKQNFFHIRNSVALLKSAALSVEFRTTVIPGLHEPEEVMEIARSIAGAPLYTLQQFNPRKTLHPSWQHIIPYSKEQMETMARHAELYVDEVRVLNI